MPCPLPLSSFSPLFPLGAHLTTTSFDLATEVAGDVVSHQIWGPRKKSWSLPMTILAGVMRGAGRHSNLVDIVRFTSFLRPSLASDHVALSRLLSGCSWDLADLCPSHRMPSSLRSPSACENAGYGESSLNLMSWRMARVNSRANGSSPRGFGNVYRQNGRHPKQNLAPIHLPHLVNIITKELSYISMAVSPPRDAFVNQSDLELFRGILFVQSIHTQVNNHTFI
jgi:hypothetical protein